MESSKNRVFDFSHLTVFHGCRILRNAEFSSFRLFGFSTFGEFLYTEKSESRSVEYSSLQLFEISTFANTRKFENSKTPHFDFSTFLVFDLTLGGGYAKLGKVVFPPSLRPS